MKSIGRALRVGILGAMVVGSGCGADADPLVSQENDCLTASVAPGTQLLVFSRTAGFRHQSIPAGVDAITGLGERYGFAVEHTEDATQFNDESLARFSAVVFLNTTGDVLDSEQETALERYIRGGGGYVGVHSASDTEYDWEWYGRLVGAYFERHPRIQSATILVEDTTHVSTRCVPPVWTRTDEWYDFHATPPPEVNILARLDEGTYEDGQMGEDHPIAWYHHFDGGRAWYTGLGHTEESYSEPAFLDHLAGGILWAAAIPP